jgi:hypothetical protein
MLNSISWGQYITTIITLLILYYFFVGVKYFRWEILSLIGIKKVEDNKISIPVFGNTNQPVRTENHEDYLPRPNLEIDISPVVQSFTDEVQAYIDEVKPKVPASELLYSLELIGAKYPALKNADCRDELLQMVFTRVNKRYPGLLEQDDVSSLWK